MWALLTTMQERGASTREPLQLRLDVVWSDSYVEMDPVLDRLALGNQLEEDASTRTGIRVRMADRRPCFPHELSRA